MPTRSPRLIYAFWDARDETFFEDARRSSRQLEYLQDLPQFWVNAILSRRRTVYTYGKRVRARGIRSDGMRINNLVMRTTSRFAPGRGVSEYALMKRAMGIFITCWEPYVCGVRTKTLDALHSDPGPFRAAWMLYVHPSLAATVVVPDVPIVETTPDGGLFLAATARPFKTEDPDHVAAALRIAAAVAHLNVERSPVASDPFPSWDGSYSTNYFEPRDRLWLGTTLAKITPDQALHPDRGNPQVIGRVGPPDGAWEADLAREGPCVSSECFAPW